MSQDREVTQTQPTKAPAQPLRPEESINSTSANADETPMREIPIGEADVALGGIEYGEMNEEDARESGYITDDANH